MLTVYDRAPWQWSIMIRDNLLARKLLIRVSGQLLYRHVH